MQMENIAVGMVRKYKTRTTNRLKVGNKMFQVLRDQNVKCNVTTAIREFVYLH
jgi:hypothetical protein